MYVIRKDSVVGCFQNNIEFYFGQILIQLSSNQTNSRGGWKWLANPTTCLGSHLQSRRVRIKFCRRKTNKKWLEGGDGCQPRLHNSNGFCKARNWILCKSKWVGLPPKWAVPAFDKLIPGLNGAGLGTRRACRVALRCHNSARNCNCPTAIQCNAPNLQQIPIRMVG
jgi:hypothetical protein